MSSSKRTANTLLLKKKEHYFNINLKRMIIINEFHKINMSDLVIFIQG